MGKHTRVINFINSLRCSFVLRPKRSSKTRVKCISFSKKSDYLSLKLFESDEGSGI